MSVYGLVNGTISITHFFLKMHNTLAEDTTVAVAAHSCHFQFQFLYFGS